MHDARILLLSVVASSAILAPQQSHAHYHLVTWATFPDISAIPNNTTIDRQFNGWGARYYGDLLTIRDDTGVSMSNPNVAVLRNTTDNTLPATVRQQYVIHFTDFPSVADFIGVTPIDAASAGTVFTLRAFDSEDTLLGELTTNVAATHQYSMQEDTELVLFFRNMAYVEFSITAPPGQIAEVVIGNLRYNHIVPAPGASGVVLVCAAALRRRRATSR